MNLRELIESLQIFSRHHADGLEATYQIEGHHDTILGPELPTDESDDGKRLTELGWHRSDGYWELFT